nr:MAG TPA: hypothetical protein [Bacteriophage sp.]
MLTVFIICVEVIYRLSLQTTYNFLCVVIIVNSTYKHFTGVNTHGYQSWF